MRLLVVEDDAETRDFLVRALRAEGHVVVAVGSGMAAKASLREQPADLIVLDLGLPDGDGLSFCSELRDERHTIPVLMLTAHSEISTRVRCFDVGVDDFLGKPFAVAELRARVRALGRRRSASESSPARVSLGDVTLHLAARRATRAMLPVRLTAREWAVLEALALRPGRLVSRLALLEEAWGESSKSASASLEVMVARIRRKLGEQVIRTIRGEGYALQQDG